MNGLYKTELIGRHGPTLVLGGTAEPDDKRSDPDPATTRAILARCARLD